MAMIHVPTLLQVMYDRAVRRYGEAKTRVLNRCEQEFVDALEGE